VILTKCFTADGPHMMVPVVRPGRFWIAEPPREGQVTEGRGSGQGCLGGIARR